jgi:hypothetical protein
MELAFQKLRPMDTLLRALRSNLHVNLVVKVLQPKLASSALEMCQIYPELCRGRWKAHHSQEEMHNLINCAEIKIYNVQTHWD